MFPDSLPVISGRRNASIDCKINPTLEFQFATKWHRYPDDDPNNGPNPLVWPDVPNYVKDGTTCIMCLSPFGPKGGWSLGTCRHMYHPVCLIPHMVTRKRCPGCKAPFHNRLYKMFGLENHMPLHFEYTAENLRSEDSKKEWGKDMVWLWSGLTLRNNFPH